MPKKNTVLTAVRRTDFIRMHLLRFTNSAFQFPKLLRTKKSSDRSVSQLWVWPGPMIPQARGSQAPPADGVSIRGRAAVHSRGATDLEREGNPVLWAEQVTETRMQAQKHGRK